MRQRSKVRVVIADSGWTPVASGPSLSYALITDAYLSLTSVNDTSLCRQCGGPEVMGPGLMDCLWSLG